MIIAAVVGGFMLVDAGGDAWTARATRSWPTTEGTVVESGLVREDSGLGTQTVARIEYLYTAPGAEPVIGTAVWACECASEAEDAAALERFGAGAEVEVHYDPDDPERAVLLTGAPAGVWTKLGLGAALLLFALGYGLLRSRSRAGQGYPERPHAAE